MLWMGHTRRMLAVAMIATTGLLLAACTTASTTGQEPSGLSASLTDFKIATSGSVAAGSPFEIAVSNDGKTIHSMAIVAGEKTVGTPVLDAGKTTTLSVPALAAGTYKLFCTVGGHREAGMETMLTVGSGPSGSSMSPEEMDRAHEAGVKAFPAKTEGTPGSVLGYRVAGGVKMF